MDTGPLVAILSREDAHHRTCVEALLVLACHHRGRLALAAFSTRVQQLLGTMNSGFLELLPLAASEAKGIAAVMKKYEGIRAQSHGVGVSSGLFQIFLAGVVEETETQCEILPAEIAGQRGERIRGGDACPSGAIEGNISGTGR